jgi:hypothetical protein
VLMVGSVVDSEAPGPTVTAPRPVRRAAAGVTACQLECTESVRVRSAAAAAAGPGAAGAAGAAAGGGQRRRWSRIYAAGMAADRSRRPGRRGEDRWGGTVRARRPAPGPPVPGPGDSLTVPLRQ